MPAFPLLGLLAALLQDPTTLAISTKALFAVFSAGAAFGGAKIGLNGTKKRVERIEGKVDVLAEDVAYLRGAYDSERKRGE